MNKIIEKYMKLEIDTKEFIDALMSDEHLFKEMIHYLPTEKTINEDKWKGFVYTLLLKTHGYDLNRLIKFGFSNGANPFGKSAMYNFIYKVLEINKYKFEFNDFYRKRYMLLMDIMPNYIGGYEAENYIDSFVSNLDANIHESQKKKQIKQMIKEKFVCLGKNKPKWIQEPEWPVSEKPMMFVSQLQEGDRFIYTFKDVTTGQTREIVQFA